MKLDKEKLLLALAEACMNPYDLCAQTGIQYQTYRRIIGGQRCKTATAGKIAKALGISVKDIILQED